MSSLRKQPTLNAQQTLGSLKWMLDELQDPTGGEGAFGSVSLDDLFQGPLEREPGPSWDQMGTADGSPPLDSNASAPGPDLRGKSVEEVWQAIHQSPASKPAQNPEGRGPMQQQEMYSRAVQQHEEAKASLQHSHGGHAELKPGVTPHDQQLLGMEVQQHSASGGHALDMLPCQRLQTEAPSGLASASGRAVNSHRTGALANCNAMSLPDAEAQPMNALEWPGSIPSAPLSAALPGSMPLTWPGLPLSNPQPAQLPASMPAALSTSRPASVGWAAPGGTTSMPAAAPAAVPGYPRSSQPQPSVKQHTSHNMSMPILLSLQVPSRAADGSSRAHVDPTAWPTGAGAQSQPTAAPHGRRAKAPRKAAPLESQPDFQVNPAAKVFRPMTPSSPEAQQQPDWPQGTDVPAAKAARQHKRKGSSEEPGDERQTKRMVKNRESAARSRLRKQAYTIDLESQVEDLRRENKDLLEKVIKACPPPDPKHMPVVDGEALRRTRTTPM